MRRLAVALLGFSLAAPAGAQTAPQASLASAMIDPTLFRDGEVRRSAEAYGAWTLLCDAVPRLGRKFCSLRSAPVPIGAAAIALTVSTGDDGRPAALLRLPFGLALVAGVTIGVTGRGKAHQVPIALCDGAGCAAVWTIDAAELDALRRGAPLRITMQGWTPDHPRGRPPMVVSVPGTGFPEALTASLR